jgi:hypothetical protein
LASQQPRRRCIEAAPFFVAPPSALGFRQEDPPGDVAVSVITYDAATATNSPHQITAQFVRASMQPLSACNHLSKAICCKRPGVLAFCERFRPILSEPIDEK